MERCKAVLKLDAEAWRNDAGEIKYVTRVGIFPENDLEMYHLKVLEAPLFPERGDVIIPLDSPERRRVHGIDPDPS